MDGTTMRVRAAERRFLCWGCWAFPAMGLIAAMLTGGGFWTWVNGDCPWLDWRQAFTGRGALLGGMGLAVVCMWRASLRWEWPGWALALMLAVGFAVAECAVRIPETQTAFWLATRARGYLPEVGYIRLEEAAGRPEDGPGIILAGSSQMIFGVDENLLRKMLAPMPVLRRSISGMWPQSMLAMWGRFSFRNEDVCVQVRSAFDFLGKPEFDADWFRPVSSLEGLDMVLETVGWRILTKHCSKVPDFLLATVLEGWRMRDGMRVLTTQFMREPKHRAETVSVPNIKNPVWGEMKWSEWQWNAFYAGARRLKESGVTFWVFEGDVNPAFHDAEWEAKRTEWIMRMEAGEREGLWRLIGLEEQEAGLVTSDWADGTHVNATGKKKLTLAMGKILSKYGSKK